MCKIFSTQFHQGKLTEKISGELLTNNGAVFNNTDKGLAMRFNGTSDNINFITNETINNITSITVEASIFVDFSQRFFIVMKEPVNSVWQLYAETSIGVIRWRGGGGASQLDAPIPEPNKWHHIVATQSGTTAKIYIDGQLVNTGTVQALGSSTNDVVIGKYGSSYYFNGDMGDIGIWDEELSQTEIDNLYKDFLARKPLSIATRNFYYPKPTRLDEDGLVGAYNMIPSANNTLVDISGNGQNGTINGPLSTKDGMAFDGVDDYIEFPTRTQTGSFTLSTIFSTNKIATQNIVSDFTFGSTARILYLFVSSAGSIALILGEATNAVVKTGVSLGEIYVTTITYDSSTLVLSMWVNGEKIDEKTGVPNISVTKPIRFGANLNGTFTLDGNIYDVKLYNKTLTDQQIKDYHNKRASQIYINETFKYLKCDGTNQVPVGRIPGTGLFKGIEKAGLDGNSNALECTSTSFNTILYNSKQAYGTYEFEMSIGPSSIANSFVIISSDGDIFSGNGYYINFNVNRALVLVKVASGVSTAISRSIDNYIANDVFYGIKLTRSNDGVFTIYIKGGSFGKSYIKAVMTTLGSNPITDNDYNTSNFIFLSSNGAGGKYANIELTKGIVV